MKHFLFFIHIGYLLLNKAFPLSYIPKRTQNNLHTLLEMGLVHAINTNSNKAGVHYYLAFIILIYDGGTRKLYNALSLKVTYMI